MHFDVHKRSSNTTNQKAVVSLMVNKKSGIDNKLIKHIIDSFGEEKEVDMKNLLGSTIPSKPIFYNY